MIIQILGALTIILALGIVIYYTRIYGVDKIILFLSIVFLTLFVLVAFPSLFRDKIAFGFIRPLDAFLTFTSMAALLMSLALYLRLKKTEKDITRIVQEISLLK